MNSNSRIRLFVILAFLASGGLLYYAYNRMQENVNRLVVTVKESAEPDKDLIRIKELWTTISAAGNSVRAFTVTRENTYLVQFLEMKDTLKAGIDSLKTESISSGRSVDDLIRLDTLINSKISVYEGLLDINYNRIINNAIKNLDETTLENDTTDIFKDQGNMVQRMFSGKYSRKALKAKADSMLAERNTRVAEYNKNANRIREEEAAKIKEQSEKELKLLTEDKIISAQIERVIKKLEATERERITDKATESERAAGKAAEEIRNIVLAGLILVLILLIFVLRDIEISNKRRKELLQAKQQAEKLARAKEEFMSTMSHEIRTPLTSVIGFSEKLSQTKLDDTQSRYIKAISGSSGHLLSIVNDVLDFTRVDSGKLKFEEVSFRAADIFSDVCESLTWKAEEKGILLRFYIQPIATLMLNGDPIRLRQVLFNLIGNAIKFTEKGSVDVTATFTDENGKAILLFNISDTGIGIPSKRIAAIFGEFEQADASVARKFGGSGLGLSISKRIVEQQGGTISVESVQAIGSVFSVKLPYKWGELEPREVSFTEDARELPLRGLSVILAEDDPMIRELQQHSLENMGARVFIAENGKKALEYYHKNYADFILMDIQMPEMTGPEAVKIIRNEFPESKRNIPVIAMTANILQHDLKQWMDEGMSDFITKPFREQELLEKIGKLLKIDTKFKQEIEKPKKKDAEPYKFNQPRPEKYYDLTELKASSQGNNDFTKKMINLFLTSAFASVNNLKFHLKQNNWDQLSKTSHRMIGSYKQMGVDYVATMLKELEDTASGSRELGKAAWLVNEIESYSSEVFKLLKIELEKYSTT